ncbi:hypothetical protein CWI38_0683p0020 [Hamiltosporidium tvaerminnensis]|uniref:Uncharacterized protein n=1 Tax=Hamiltosporidium tvaerminnensis TaxID=1176355 RepID=A0A4Q9LWG5_9MICR|nr:hypothetical protein LUQ84_002906 [Hamiltosporidium tvaerminnensis]TBU12646.1 hypothetical protein CWI38_0683p0020 [Hamiltosporidium tvaerminnensis]
MKSVKDLIKFWENIANPKKDQSSNVSTLKVVDEHWKLNDTKPANHCNNEPRFIVKNEARQRICLGLPFKEGMDNDFHKIKEAPVYVAMVQANVYDNCGDEKCGNDSKKIFKNDSKNDIVNYLDNSSSILSTKSIKKQVKNEKSNVQKNKRKKRWEGISDPKERLSHLYI